MSAPWPGPVSRSVPGDGGGCGAGAPGATVAYVSLKPGTLPAAQRVTVTSKASLHCALSPFVVDGGFDPLAILAGDGDTLKFVVDRTDGGHDTFAAVVSPTAAPVVVRMAPAAGTADVPLNANIYAVFSEPFDARVLTPSAIRLLHGAGAVAGSPRFRDGTGLAVEFVPEQPLEAGEVYQLDITTAAMDRRGASLATPIRAEFATRSATAASALVIGAFSVIEFEYEPGRGFWYAPQILVKETSGKGSATVYSLEVTLPGLGYTGRICSKGMYVAPGGSRQLVGEIYGDWELEYGPSAARLTPGVATVTIAFRDETGRSGTLTANGPVTPGALPTTYTGGVSSMAPGACVLP